MHDWAVTVERLSGRLHVDLKSGIGPEPVLELLRAISSAIATEEVGEEVGSNLLAEIDARRAAALPYL